MSILFPKNIFTDGPLRVLKLIPLTVAVLFLPQAQAAVIDLGSPVSESITVDGIYWTGDTITPGSPNGSTADSSGNGYNGVLEAGVDSPAPSLVTGVNLPGTSGYSNAIRLSSNVASPPVTDRNSRIYYNTPSSGSKLSMAATDFTAGAWIKFSSLQAGAQMIMIMDRGTRDSSAATNGGGWSFFFEKNASGLWRIGFTARDNSASTTIYNGAYSDLGISLDQWIHLGFAFDDKDSDPNAVTFFLNGTAINTVNIARNITEAKDTASGRRFSVGERSASAYTSTFDGAVDDIFVTTGLHSFQAVVPEPSSVALIAIVGGGVMVFWSLRRNKNSAL